MKKLTKKELKQLQEEVGRLNDVYINIGKLEMQKQFLMKHCNKLETEVKELTNEFEEKYGQVEVNINTGEMRKIKDNE
jgi:vacuolar-type H+-ATPase subunit D/Vma8